MPIPLERHEHNDLQPVQNPQDARTVALAFGPNLTVPRGAVVGIVTATKKGGLYADANVDGTGVAYGINKTAFVTDANGHIFFGGAGTNTNDSRVASNSTATVYVHGTFDPQELVGYDAAALADLKGRLLSTGFPQF